jgi:hypothetical protein
LGAAFDLAKTFALASGIMTIYDVFKSWEKAPIKNCTPEEVHELQQSVNFYDVCGYWWKDQPKIVDGEVGYDDDSGFRITCK